MCNALPMCLSSFVKSASTSVHSEAFSLSVLWTCTSLEYTAIARPSVSTLALTTVVLCIMQRFLSDTVLLPMPLVSNRALEKFVRAAKSFYLVLLRRSQMTPFGLSLMRHDGFAPWHGEWAGPIFPAPKVPQRTRKASPYDGDCPPQPAKCRRWAPVFPQRSPPNLLLFVRMVTLLFANVFVGFHWHPVRRGHLCHHCSVRRRRWSQFAIVPRSLPHSDLSVAHGNLD